MKALLFTGGKDSCLALLKTKPSLLLAVIPKNSDSLLFHKPNEKILRQQAKLCKLPLIIEEGDGNKVFIKLMRKAREKGVTKIIAGTFASDYQKDLTEKIARELGMKAEFPLWHKNPEKLWKEMIKKRMKVILVKIASEGIGKKWLGKVIGKKELKELIKLQKKYKFCLMGEGGDFETLCIKMPGWKKHMRIKSKIRSEGEYRHFLIIK